MGSEGRCGRCAYRWCLLTKVAIEKFTGSSGRPATYRVALLSIPGVGRRTAARVLQQFPTADALLGASTADLAALAGIAGRVRAGLQKQVREQLQPATDAIRAMERRGVTALTPDTRWFPHRLATMPDPPIVLFLRGDPDPLVAPGVAVVGTRTPTSIGVAITRRVTHWLVKQDYGIVSGLALGVDAAAHEAAVQAGGRTVAFLPSALDRIYPPEQKELAERIAKNGGALVSEYSQGHPRGARHLSRGTDYRQARRQWWSQSRPRSQAARCIP